jgi:hypothetical protein
MSSALGAIAPLLLAAVSAAPAVPPDSGHVRFVTGKRIYLDKGAADGLNGGQEVSFSRGQRTIGRCPIDVVGAHVAVCRGGGVQVGDAFALPKRPPASARRARATLPAPEPAEVVERRALAIAGAPHAKVDFEARARSAYPGTASLGAGVAVYATTPRSPQYIAETLDVALRHLPLGDTGLRFDAALSLLRVRTASEPRFRPGGGTEVYLWDAEISRREIDSRTVLAMGRIWPWHTPGLAILDGVQLGRRNESGSVEGGAYGGVIPETLTLEPTLDSWTGGLYGALSQAGARDDVVRLAQEEGRISMRHSPTVGWVREAQARGALELRGGGIAGSGRVREAPEVDSGPVLELADGEVWVRPGPELGAALQVRYLGVAPERQPLLRDELPRVLGGTHGSFSFSWDPARWVGAAVTGDAHHEQDGDLNEVNAGLDLHLPRLLGDLGGVWLGVAVGQGWMESRSAYVQMILAAPPRLRFLGRFGGDVSRFSSPDGAIAVSELGGSLQLEGRITSRLRFVARTLLRVPLAIAGIYPDASLGLVSSLDLVADY